MENHNHTVGTSMVDTGQNTSLRMETHIMIPPPHLDTDYINIGAYFIGIVGMLGNGFVLCILLRDKKLRKKISNLLIINQSLVDFSTSVFFLMCFGSRALGNSYSGWRGRIVCVLLDSEGPVWLFLCISTAGLVLITLERYWIIVHPLAYRNTISPCLVKVAIVTSWFLTSGLVGIPLFYTAGVGDDNKCYTVGLWPNESHERSYCIFYIVLTFLIPVCLFIGCYSHMMVVMARRLKLRYLKSDITIQVESGVISTMKQTSAGSRLSSKQVNLTRTMIIVCACFVACFAPSDIHYFLTTFDLVPGLELSGPLYTVLTYLTFFNTCINPFIYSFRYEDVRKGAKEIFLKICKHKAADRSQSIERQSQATVTTRVSEFGNAHGLSVSNTMLGSDNDTSGEVPNS